MRRIALHREHLATVLTAGVLLFTVVSALHFVGSSSLFPHAGTSVLPIGHVDYSLQYYYGRLGSELLHGTGVPYGYDPRFLSGYVKSPAYYPSSMPFEFALYLLRGLPTVLVFNWTVFVLLALCPLLMVRAAANFGLKPWERFALVLLLLAPEAMEPHLSLFVIMRGSGMVAFIFASFLSVYVVSLFFRFLTEGRSTTAIALFLFAPMLFLVHPTAPVMVIVPLAALYLWKLRKLTIRQHVVLFSVAAAVLAVNWFWIHATITFAHYADLHAFDDEEAIGHFSVNERSFFGPLRTYLLSPTLLGRIPLVLGCAGFVMWWRLRITDRIVAFGTQIFFLTLLTYYGDRIGLNSMSPGRFTLPLALYLFFPTAYAIAAASRAVAEECRLRLSSRQRLILAALLLATVPSVLPAPFLRRILLDDPGIPLFQMRSGYSTTAGEMTKWLEANTDKEGRILHEETSRFAHEYYGTYLASLFPLSMDREFANGPAPFPLVQQNVLRFAAGKVQEQPIEEFDATELAEKFRRYNVRWILCWSDASKAYFATVFRGAELVDIFEKFELYRMEENPGYFAKGSGSVSAETNALTVTHAVAEQDELVLRYHWDENFRSDPPAQLYPVAVPGDPVSFIGVRHPPASFRLTFDY